MRPYPAALLLILCLMVLFGPIAYAEDTTTTEQDSSWWGKILQGILSVFMMPFEGIPEPADYIFNQEPDKIYGLYTTDEWNSVIRVGTHFVLMCVAVLLVAAIVWDGVKVSAMSINPSTRQYLINQAATWLVVALLWANIWYIIDLVFHLNELIVNAFKSLINPNGVTMMDITANVGGGAIGKAIVDLMYLIGINLWMAFYYTQRKLMLTLLIILSPLFIAFMLSPKLRTITAAWAKEFLSTVFAQSIHAIMFWVFVATTQANTHWFISLVFMMTFIPVSESIRFLFGATNADSKIAMGATIMGLGGLMHAGYVLRNATQGMSGAVGSHAQALFGGGGPVSEGGSVVMNSANNTAALGGVTKSGATMLKGGMVGQAIGRGALGMAGAIGTAPLGPFGAFMGAAIGSGIGDVAGGVAGRTTTALGIGAAKVGQETYAFGRDSGMAVRENFKQAMDNFEEPPRMMDKIKVAAQATRTGFAQTASEKASNFYHTHLDSPDKRQRLYAHTGGMVLGTIGGRTGYQIGGTIGAQIGQWEISRAQSKGDFPTWSMGDLPDTYNGHAIPYRVVTTTNESYLEKGILNESGELLGYERIGSFGSGDVTLKPGEKVYRDYRIHVNDANQKIFVPYAPKSSNPENFDQSGRPIHSSALEAQVTMPGNYKLDEKGGRIPTRQGSVSSPEAYLLDNLRQRRMSRRMDR